MTIQKQLLYSLMLLQINFRYKTMFRYNTQQIKMYKEILHMFVTK